MQISRRVALTVSSLTATTLLASGCGALTEEDGEPDAALTVAAGFYPLAWVAEQVAGEHAEVVTLSRPGQDAHDAELTISARAVVSDADLVVISRGFQPSVDAGADQAEGQVLDATQVVQLREVTDHSDHDHADEERTDEHIDDHTDDHADEHIDEEPADAHDGHDHGDTDPHFWLDPLLMADLGDAVAEELAALEPDVADDVKANAADLRTQLEKLDADYTAGLGTCERETVVVSHDAFGYLSRYGLEFEPIAGLSPGAEPTPADLARLQELIREEGVTTVFNEVLAPVELAESLARDAGVTTAVLNPIEGLSDSDGDEDYLSLMRANLSALTEANGC